MKEKISRKLKTIFCAWLITLYVVAAIAPRFIPQTLFVGNRNLFGEHLPRMVWLWANLDGNHYLSIARDGYYEFEFGFFPLYPILIRFLTVLSGEPVLISALIISYGALFCFLVIFFKLLRLDFKERESTEVIVWLFVFPTAFFLISAYNDSLFLFLATSCFYAARKKQWWFAGLMGFFAALTRITGLALFPGLLVEWYLHSKKRKDLVPVFLTPLGLLSYLLYLNWVEGSWLLLFKSMAVWGQGHFVFPLQTGWRYIRLFFTLRTFGRVFLIAMIEMLSVILSLILLLQGWKRIRPSYVVYIASLLIIPLSSGTLSGLPRYFIHAFPLIIILSLITGKKQHHYLIMAVSFFLQIVLVSFFSQGYFVS